MEQDEKDRKCEIVSGKLDLERGIGPGGPDMEHGKGQGRPYVEHEQDNQDQTRLEPG